MATSRVQVVLIVLVYACTFGWILSCTFFASSASASCDTNVSAVVFNVSQGRSGSECKLDINYKWRERNLTSWLFDNCPYKFSEPYHRSVCFKEKSPLQVHPGDWPTSSVKKKRISLGFFVSFCVLLVVIIALMFWSDSNFKLPQLSWPRFRYLQWSGETELSQQV